MSLPKTIRLGAASLVRSAGTLRMFPAPTRKTGTKPSVPVVSAQQTIENAWAQAGRYLNKWLPEKSPEKSG